MVDRSPQSAAASGAIDNRGMRKLHALSTDIQATRRPSSPPSIHGASPTSPRARRSVDVRSGDVATSPVASASDPSLIFERDVQEPTISSEVAPDIPAHIKTEDQIPPALEASSLAITDSHLSPEEVEIVTHAAHQPAAAVFAQSSTSPHASEVQLPHAAGEASPDVASPNLHSEAGDGGMGGYGALDPNDVRRLSFISFADVVQAEHAEHAESAHSLQQNPGAIAPLDAALASHAAATTASRSPPLGASPPFSHGTVTPPGSSAGAPSMKATELSPARSVAGSPSVLSPQLRGDLSIETLGQALRKTASRDFAAFGKSPPAGAA